MERVLDRAGIKFNAEDLRRLVDRADKNRNRSINWQEYLSMMITINHQTQQRIKQQKEAEVKQAFTMVDLDNDGLVDFQEFITFFQEMKDLEQDPTKLRELFDAVDANQDGNINFDEFQ